MPKHKRPRRFIPLHSPKSLVSKAEGWTVAGDKKATTLIHRLLKGI
jgi:hypothetical protein